MLTFTFKRKHQVKVNIYKPIAAVDRKMTLVFMTATGVPLRKYAKLFENLVAKGYTLIGADYPCCGENTPHVDRSIDYNYQDLMDNFIPKLVGFSEHDSTYLFGHSLGGQMAAIYSALTDMPMIGVATGNIHFKNWFGWERIKILRVLAIFKPLTLAYGYFPGYKVGFGNKEAKGLMDDWCYLLKTGRFDFIKGDLTTGKGRGFFIHIEGDRYSPYASVKHLTKLCTESTLISVELPKHLKGNPHGIWIKDPEFITKRIDQQIVNGH
ncbi:alpha/beta fold hydrolase [Psychrobacter urativorans]|uniref:alpha/beta fold hydrolase n=1 Tax=Psychrobacter urativorans TaxID=45610 RepID=UPI003BB69600